MSLTNPDDRGPAGSGRARRADAIPDAEARRFAVDPRHNVVLEASAGTGKTAVLVERYVNLLLAGVAPEHILAITFTRKAAAEMRERIVGELGQRALAGALPSARWAEIRERLGEMAISTIDAFCLALLSEFPLEADLEPGVTLLDEAEVPPLQAEAVERAIRRAVRRAPQDPSLALAISHLGVPRLRAALMHLLGRRLLARAALDGMLARAQPVSSGEAAGRRALEETVATLESGPGGLSGFLETGPSGHPDFAQLAATLTAFSRAGEPGATAWRRAVDQVAAYFLTREDERPRQVPDRAYRAFFPSAEAQQRHRDAFAILAPRIAHVLRKFRADLNIVLVRGLAQVFTLAAAEYRRLLEEMGALDFDSVLERALELLRQMDEFAQSRYRLEARYRHVLVDEFQDTSRAQWELVWLLIESWGAGLGAAADDGLAPTIFLVGDRKQSIYGFRDAEVALLDHAAVRIERLRPEGRCRRSISCSFRAVPTLLAFVNDLFSEIVALDGTADGFRYDDADRFPLPESASSGEPPEPALGVIVADTVDECARRAAAEILRLLEKGRVRDRHSGEERPVRPADIAILFRSRETHRAFEHALLTRGVPTYVYKGLGFFDTDEVKDLTALVRFLADPASDLRAAAFLRSRFVRLSDIGLARLAPELARALTGRGEPAAAAALSDDDRAVLRHVRAAVQRWIGRVDRIPPAELLDDILQESAYSWELGGPRVRQARENVKKFRSLVRRLQNRGYLTMARLAARLDQFALGDESNAVVDAAEAVNLMTIHAAKGLEFPVVFVVNLDRGTGGQRAPVQLVPDRGDGEPLVGVENLLAEASDVQRKREREETKRLLYVAVTRARDRLYLSVSRASRQGSPSRGSLAEVLPSSLLHTMRDAAQAAEGAVVTWSSSGGRVHRLRVCGATAPADASWSGRERAVADRRIDLRPLRPGGVPRVSVTASLDDSARAPSSPAELPTARSERLVGRLVHRLLERWGLVPPADEVLEEEVRRCLRWDEGAAVTEMASLLREARAIYKALCRRPDVMTVFDGRCEYEVPFAVWVEPRSGPAAGAMDGPAVVRGVIDCLVWKADGTVVVIELKTGAPRPEHQQQLDWYVEAVKAWLPGRPVSGLLLYA